jgi:hypothetical protein
METNIEKGETPTSDDTTEQYIKDVRSVEYSDDDTTPLQKEDLKEAEGNELAQEENKKSQMNAELDANLGDVSDPDRAQKKK